MWSQMSEEKKKPLQPTVINMGEEPKEPLQPEQIKKKLKENQ